MTSNGKHFTITREILIAVARDQRWLDVVAGISRVFQNLLLFCFAINKSLNDWSLEVLGKQNSLFPSGPVIGIRIAWARGQLRSNFTSLFEE